jgi:hypothetical protein
MLRDQNLVRQSARTERNDDENKCKTPCKAECAWHVRPSVHGMLGRVCMACKAECAWHVRPSVHGMLGRVCMVCGFGREE